MGLSCGCDVGESDWYYVKPDDYSVLATKRRRRCCSCKELIEIGATCAEFTRWRDPIGHIEESIHGDEVPIAPWFMCEECADLFFSITELGYCVTLGDEPMRDLAETISG